MQQTLISQSDIEKLKEYKPDIEKVFQTGDIDEIQIAIMEAIDKTLDKDSEATPETFVLEKIYDKVSHAYKVQKLKNKFNS